MGRKPAEALTPRETELMELLWRLESATAEEIRAALPGEANDSTVRTMLRVLVEKGHVKREPKCSPARYRPTTKRAKAQTNALQDLLNRFFAGSAEDLVLKLVDDEQLTPEQLAQLTRKFGTPKNTKGDNK